MAAKVDWVGGAHAFALPLGRLRALQQSCDAGPEEILIRLRAGKWRIDDLIEILRHGLIGGGMPEDQAGPLVTRLFAQHGALEFKMTAFSVLQAALTGDVGDDVGKAEGPATKEAPESGNSPASTVSAQ